MRIIKDNWCSLLLHVAESLSPVNCLYSEGCSHLFWILWHWFKMFLVIIWASFAKFGAVISHSEFVWQTFDVQLQLFSRESVVSAYFVCILLSTRYTGLSLRLAFFPAMTVVLKRKFVVNVSCLGVLISRRCNTILIGSFFLLSAQSVFTIYT